MVTLDVGAVLPDESSQYITQTYPPQNEPTLGDILSIAYGSAHPQSWYISAGIAGGQNAAGTVVGAGVNSVAVEGESALQGDVRFVESDGIDLVQDSEAKTITISAVGIGVLTGDEELRLFFGG